MSSTTTKKTTTKKATVAAPAPTPAPAPAPVVVAPVVVAPAPVTVPVATEVAPVDEGASLLQAHRAQGEKIAAALALLKEIQADHKKQERSVIRADKKLQKKRGRKAAAATEGGAASTKPYVFTKLNNVSDELCVFLGKPKGSQFSRSEVTRAVIGYAREKGLMKGQNIGTDAPLRKLLAIDEAQVLTILNLQRYLKVHYPKAATA